MRIGVLTSSAERRWLTQMQPIAQHAVVES